MAFQILLNIGLAIIWMFFKNSFTAVDFVAGYIVALGILYAMRRFLNYDFYFRRVIAAIKLILLFTKELVLSNIQIAKILLSPKLNIIPGIVAVPTKLKTDLEVTLLASLISLTPGTLSMDFSKDGRIIFIHAIHVPDKDKFIAEIQGTFEKAIMEVTH